MGIDTHKITLLLLVGFLLVWGWTEVSEHFTREDFKAEVKEFMRDHERRVDVLERE